MRVAICPGIIEKIRGHGVVAWGRSFSPNSHYGATTEVPLRSKSVANEAKQLLREAIALDRLAD